MKNWKRYGFDLGWSCSVIPSKMIDITDRTIPAGVYMLVTDGQIQYVGQALNPLSRVNQHATKGHESCFPDFDQVFFFPVPDKADRDALEGALIRYYRPYENTAIGCPRDQGRDREMLELVGLWNATP